jgi:hypothetical protein
MNVSELGSSESRYINILELVINSIPVTPHQNLQVKVLGTYGLHAVRNKQTLR